MQTKQVLEMKKELENKVNNMIDCTLLEISKFYFYLKEMRTNIVDEREGLGEMDEYGIALDEMLLLVEEAQAALSPYSEMYEEVFHNLDVVSCKLSKDSGITGQHSEQNA